MAVCCLGYGQHLLPLRPGLVLLRRVAPVVEFPDGLISIVQRFNSRGDIGHCRIIKAVQRFQRFGVKCGRNP